MAVITTQNTIVPIIEVVEAENRITFEFGGELIEFNYYIDVTQKSVSMVLGDLTTAVEERRLGTYLTGAFADNLLQPDPDNPYELSSPMLLGFDAAT